VLEYTSSLLDPSYDGVTTHSFVRNHIPIREIETWARQTVRDIYNTQRSVVTPLTIFLYIIYSKLIICIRARKILINVKLILEQTRLIHFVRWCINRLSWDATIINPHLFWALFKWFLAFSRLSIYIVRFYVSNVFFLFKPKNKTLESKLNFKL